MLTNLISIASSILATLRRMSPGFRVALAAAWTALILALAASSELPGAIDDLPLGPRKVGHFAVYAILGLLVNLAVFDNGARASGLALMAPLALGIMVAGTDEIIQTFVPPRSGQLMDVLIDAAGVASAQAAILALELHALRRAIDQSKFSPLVSR
jgi:VanZ family protein